MYQYLTPENIFTRFDSSKTYTDSLTTKFPEYQRIADNRHKDNMEKHLPKNTDGTTASIIKKTPRRVVQQLPTGKVEGAGWLPIVATYILSHEILLNANSQYDLLEKCWQTVEGSLTRGYSPIYCPIVHSGDYIGPDWINPWWGDVYIQPGKLSDTDSQYIFLRSWWREEDIDALIARLEKPDAVDGGWDVSVLREIKSHEQTKDDKAMTPSDKAQAVNARGGIELITGFQRGVGGQFLTMHRETKKIARTKKNKDPRGGIPVNFNYCETDGTNPFGRGFVSLVAPLQNLMDSDDQMYQFNRALMLGPPIIKKGTWNKSQAQFVPNSIWDLGNVPTNTAEALKIDSSALTNYPNLYQLNQSRLYNLLSAPSTAIPSGVGGIQNSKTPDGVKQTNANLSIDDNFIRKKFEASFANWAETAVNLWFAEHEGIEELQLDAETAAKLRNLEDFDPANLSDDNKVRINYDDDTEVLKFQVDASTSQKQDDVVQVATITGLLQTLEKTPALQGVIPQQKIIAAWNSIVAASGVEDPEDLRVSDEEFQQHQQQQAEQAQQQAAAEQQASAQAPTPLHESLGIKFESLAPDVQRELVHQLFGIETQQETPTEAKLRNDNLTAVSNATKAHSDVISSMVNDATPPPDPVAVAQAKAGAAKPAAKPATKKPKVKTVTV